MSASSLMLYTQIHIVVFQLHILQVHNIYIIHPMCTKRQIYIFVCEVDFNLILIQQKRQTCLIKSIMVSVQICELIIISL